MDQLTMQEQANKILSEAHNNEHKQTMDLFKKVYNLFLIIIIFILLLVFGPKVWLLLFGPLFDFKPQIKKNTFVSLNDRWGK
jgi:peptidoglycan biosynthesis protein MviN/MurJ (putative lipid II flippase)